MFYRPRVQMEIGRGRLMGENLDFATQNKCVAAVCGILETIRRQPSRR
jgi:hypothetical protein